MEQRLTKTFIDSVKPTHIDEFYWDTQIKGFGLKVTPKGKKVFIYQSRVAGETKTIRPPIGVYADKVEHKSKVRTLTVTVAREIAEIYRGKMNSGIDPRRKTSQENDDTSLLVNDLLDEFSDSHLKRLKPRTYSVSKSYVENDIKPYFKGLKIDEVSKRHISVLHSQEASQPCRANHIYAILSKFLNWCEDNDYRQSGANPCRHVKKYKIPSRERYLTEVENKRLTHVLDDALIDGSESIYVISAIKLLRLTGARRNEILSVKWKWVDLDNRVINLPDSKTGKKQIFLSEQAMGVLLAIPKVPENEHVVVGKKVGHHLVNIQKPWSRIRRLADLDDVRIHDLRHSFASLAVSNGMSLHIVGKLLGHRQASTTYKYSHLAPNTLADASNVIGKMMLTTTDT